MASVIGGVGFGRTVASFRVGGWIKAGVSRCSREGTAGSDTGRTFSSINTPTGGRCDGVGGFGATFGLASLLGGVGFGRTFVSFVGGVGFGKTCRAASFDGDVGFAPTSIFILTFF